MPQPFSRVRPNPKASFNLSDLSKVPHLITYPMQVIAIWAEIDSILAEMLTQLTNADFAVVVSMLQAVKSLEAQLDMIKAAAKHVMSEADFNLFLSVEKSAAGSRSRRHQFAHHLWGIPDDPPDSLVLLDPRDNLKGLAGIYNKITDANEHNDQHIDWSKVQLYREDDFKRDLADAQKAREWYSILPLVLLDQHPDIQNVARRQLLAELPVQHGKSTQNSQSPQ